MHRLSVVVAVIAAGAMLMVAFVGDSSGAKKKPKKAEVVILTTKSSSKAAVCLKTVGSGWVNENDGSKKTGDKNVSDEISKLYSSKAAANTAKSSAPKCAGQKKAKVEVEE
jgi:hypothetical protein